jgi:hypothetical protein
VNGRPCRSSVGSLSTSTRIALWIASGNTAHRPVTRARDGSFSISRAKEFWTHTPTPGIAAYYLKQRAGLGEVATIARNLQVASDELQHGMSSATDVAALLAYLEGTISDSDLRGRPVANEIERCRRHYVIGWKRLGAGDRAGAQAAFQEAFDAMPYDAMSWWIARAVLIRMKDPTWPLSIPRK